MLSAGQSERYLRHILVRDIGAQGQQKLLSAKILIVGVGGIGAPVLQYLCAAGIGRIDLIDDDIVELSNLQRQIIYSVDDIGRKKVDAAKDFCQKLNPDTKVTTFGEKLTKKNAVNFFENYDLVIEGVDSFDTRYIVNAASIQTRTPFISAAVGRFDGQVSLFAPFKGDLPCYRCLVPQAPSRNEQTNCLEEGVVGSLTGVVGSLVSMEVIKSLLAFGEDLSGWILIYDGLTGAIRRVRLPRDTLCSACADLNRPQRKKE